MLLDLVPLWAVILSLAVLMYVRLDGFDLGVGTLFFLRKQPQDRDLMVASVAPIWDFNETWLILGGGGLLAVLPLAFAVIMPAVYFPILVMSWACFFAARPSGFATCRRRVWPSGTAPPPTARCLVLAVVNVMHEHVQGFHPLHQARLQGFPFVRRDDARNCIEWNEAFCSGVVAVDGKGDAYAPKGQVRFGAFALDMLGRLAFEPLIKFAVMLAHRRRRSIAGMHFVEKIRHVAIRSCVSMIVSRSVPMKCSVETFGVHDKGAVFDGGGRGGLAMVRNGRRNLQT